MNRFKELLGKGLRHFKRSEDGSATIDFVIAFPAFAILFSSSLEAGLLSTRHVMLERGLDVAVREVRIGKIPNPTHDALTARICEVATIFEDCEQDIRLEMINIDPRNWVAPPSQVSCVDRAEEGDPVLNFNTGLNNELMIIRACMLFDPMLPTTGIGKEIPKETGGNAYGIYATTSYVMEPFQ